MTASAPCSRDSTAPECITLVSLDQAEALYAALSDDCVMIQAQLSDRDHRNEDGERLSDKEYHQWRSRATWALAKKRVQMGKLKRWISERKQEAVRIEAGVANPNNVVELFGALLQIVKTSGWDDLTPQEQAIIRLSERWIRVKGAPAVVAAREKAQVAS